jgi:hypothetical protein
MTSSAEQEFVPTPVLVGGTVHVGGPVHVAHPLQTHAHAADFGSYMTYATPAGADIARQILPFDNSRHRAVLVVSAPGSVAATAGVWIGTQAQCQASPPVGGYLPNGTVLAVEHNQAIWLVGDGANALRVTVVMERWVE